MLSKSHLLDLLKNYVIYEVVNNRRIKKIAKHQQYRVVTKAVERLKLEDDVKGKGWSNLAYSRFRKITFNVVVGDSTYVQVR